LCFLLVESVADRRHILVPILGIVPGEPVFRVWHQFCFAFRVYRHIGFSTGGTHMKSLLTFLAAMGFAMAAAAQELPSFEDVDLNGDGAISESEASVVEGLDFAAADANQDGGIDRDEYGQLTQ
jgi:hypothetical protein